MKVQTKKVYCIPKDAAKFKKKLDLNKLQPEDDEAAALYAKRFKTSAKHHDMQQMLTGWEEKALHERYPSRIKEAQMLIGKQTNGLIKS